MRPSSVRITLLCLWLSVLQITLIRNSSKCCSSYCNEMPFILCENGSCLCQKWLPLTMFLFFSGADPTRITQRPVDMEIIVGESIVLPCQVASDPVLDVSFSWAFNGQLIAKGDSHFELVGGVSDHIHTSWECVNGRLAPLPILLHFIPAIRLKWQLVVWHHGIIWRSLLWLLFWCDRTCSSKNLLRDK